MIAEAMRRHSPCSRRSSFRPLRARRFAMSPDSVIATFALRQIARANGGGGSLFDAHWPAFAVPAMIIAVIGAIATWIPSRRALHIDPAVLLRTD
jgi:ABC-type antimicrobial peptide transport system permease subunit